MVALAVMQQAERGLAYDTDRHALAVTVVVHRKAHDAADRLTGPKAGHTFVQLDAQRHRGHLHDAISGAATLLTTAPRTTRAMHYSTIR